MARRKDYSGQRGSRAKAVVEPDKAPGADWITIRIPVKRTGFPCIRRLDTSLDPGQYQALRDVFDGLQATHAQLQDGHVIDSQRQTVRWILEQVLAAQKKNSHA